MQLRERGVLPSLTPQCVCGRRNSMRTRLRVFERQGVLAVRIGIRGHRSSTPAVTAKEGLQIDEPRRRGDRARLLIGTINETEQKKDGMVPLEEVLRSPPRTKPTASTLTRGRRKELQRCK